MKKGNWIIKGRRQKEIAIKIQPKTAEPINKNGVRYVSDTGIKIRVSEVVLHHNV